MAHKRILFVDDDPLVLQGLRRMLYGQRNEWDMEFEESPLRVLERMAMTSFDVVVSDMRMPGMNGAQLLTEVMHRHPRTIRIILSGHADKELILKCIGSTHQYLSKPCEPETLKAVIRRATSLEYLQQHERLSALVVKMDFLPTIPALYSAIVGALNSPNTSTNDVSMLVARDIGMTARILKLVNSAFFGLSRTISDPAEAVNHLGFDTIRSLTLALDTFGQFDKKVTAVYSIEQIWRHSVSVSLCAKWIAHREGAERKVQDEAFVSGLLHDVGKLILHVNLPEEGRPISQLTKERGLSDHAAEQEVIGANHAAIGGYLLGLWGLPVPVVEAVALHHEPALAQGSDLTPLAFVHAANAIVNSSDGNGEVKAEKFVDAAYLHEVGIIDHLDGLRAAWLEAAPASSAV
jgi:HD-like signal output (HDOD) protein